MDALLRRRLMMMQGASPGPGPGPEPPTPTGYVTDGLVFYLDGINKGSVQNAWQNLVGNSSYYPLDNSTVVEQNAIVTSGISVLTPSAEQNIADNVGTIEVCAQYLTDAKNYGIIIYAASSTGLMCARGNRSRLTFSPQLSRNTYNFNGADLFSPFTASMNNVRGMLNGVLGADSGNETWSKAFSNTLGGRNDGDYKASVRIYSIRMYNRQLTQAEMLQNQAADNTRFNLGLTINTQ